MEKISKEYYEKLKTINYSKVEITLYDKLKDYGIWWVKNRVEDAENYYLYFEDKIKYFKKHIREFLKKHIKEYNEKDFNLIYNEKIGKYEAEYKKENISFERKVESKEGIPYLNPDISKLEKYTGFKQEYSFREGIKEIEKMYIM